MGDWWRNLSGEEVCHLCDQVVDRAEPDTMFGLSGAPVHGECGRRAMEAGKALEVGRGPTPQQAARAFLDKPEAKSAVGAFEMKRGKAPDA